MIPFAHLRAVPFFPGELERGLESVYEQPRSRIEIGQYAGSCHAFEPPIADDAAHDRTVLLLDMGLVVLAIRPAAREHDPFGQTVIPHRLIHEHGVVVRIESEQCKCSS